jgi:hypothetical protein
VQWLPKGQIAFEEDDGEPPTIFDAETGQIVPSEASKEPAADEASDVALENEDEMEYEEPPKEVIRYESRLGHEYRFLQGPTPMYGAADFVALRVHDLTTHELLWDIKCDMKYDDRPVVSRDGRFLMLSTESGPAILDVRRRELRPLTGSNWMFSPRGHVVQSNDASDFFGFRAHRWQEFVPFIRIVEAWWTRPRICWLDPESGRVVGRTTPVPYPIVSIAISQDGSTIAAATWAGIYIYDVPAEFR